MPAEQLILCHHSSVSILISLFFFFKKKDNLQLWSETLPLTHSRDIAAGFCATVPPKPMSPQWVCSPVACCTAVIEAAPKCRSLSASSHRVRKLCTDVSQVDNPGGARGLRDDCHWQTPTNYRLKSGRAGRLLCCIQGLQRRYEFGILSTCIHTRMVWYKPLYIAYVTLILAYIQTPNIKKKSYGSSRTCGKLFKPQYFLQPSNTGFGCWSRKTSNQRIMTEMSC